MRPRFRAAGLAGAALAALMVLAAATAAAGAAGDTPGDDPAVEAEVRAIARSLACLVCAGQSVWESPSPWARERVAEIRDMVRAGMTRRQILDAMVERYGPGVLMAPPPRGALVLFWLGPPLALGLGAVALGLWLRAARRRGARDAAGSGAALAGSEGGGAGGPAGAGGGW